MRTTKEMTENLFNELIKYDKWINLISCPVGHCDRDRNHKFYATCSYPIEYIVTEEQIKKAEEIKKERRNEILKGIKKGELVFCSMGASFVSKYADGVGNHRIRCYFRNKYGHRYFIELIGNNENENRFWIDFSIDVELQEKRKKEWDLAFEQRAAVKGRWLINNKQDYYNAFGIEKTHRYTPYRFSEILDLVNQVFDCNYKTARKIDYLVSYDEWCCEC